MPRITKQLLAGSTCDDLEDEFDEESENFDEAAEDGGLDNPGEFEPGEGSEIPEDPNVDVDVDSDIEVDVDTDLDVDVDVDVTLELFLEEDLDAAPSPTAFVSGDAPPPDRED